MQLTQSILAWHALAARDLPWRGETDPYRVYVSEIMLQQTRTQTVKRYYARFLDAFPTPAALAEAPQDQVYKLWEGLGYYARARNLQRAAQYMTERLGGQVPKSADELRALPGCGPYVAGAVSSIAFGQKELALDGNGVRVLSRISGETRDVTRPEVRRELEAFGRGLLPEEGAGEFNQALMGMGNLTCLPKKTMCGACPAARYCRAHAQGLETQIPTRPEKPPKKEENRLVAVVTDGTHVLTRRRTESLLRGLYEFINLPKVDGEAPEITLAKADFPSGQLLPLGQYDHVFTHKIWHMSGYLERVSALSCPPGYEIMNAEELAQAAMPSAMSPFRGAAEEALEK